MVEALTYEPLARPLAGRRGAGPPAGFLADRPPRDPLSEAELSLIWEGQRYPPGALAGADGRPVPVLSPGRRAGGPGPDFRDAVVALDGRERTGDVELHVRASYFMQHRHHLDPAYDRLVLHVVFLDDAGGSSPLPSGERVAVAAFQPWVASRSADIASWLERPALWREPCHDAASRLGEERVTEEVRHQGAGRFFRRTEQLAHALGREGADEALWQALLEALGYGGDRQGFRRLGKALPASLLRDIASRFPEGPETALCAALLAVAGLGAAGEVEALLPPPLAPPVRRVASRPANRPERRLAAAARLLLSARCNLAAHALSSVRSARDAREVTRDWTLKSRGGLHSGLGAGRVTEIVANAVLPFVAAAEPALAGRCLELASALPLLPPYGKTAFLERNLVRADGKRRTRSALDQQGLLALHTAWCSQGGCGRCPLS